MGPRLIDVQKTSPLIRFSSHSSFTTPSPSPSARSRVHALSRPERQSPTARPASTAAPAAESRRTRSVERPATRLPRRLSRLGSHRSCRKFDLHRRRSSGRGSGHHGVCGGFVGVTGATGIGTTEDAAIGATPVKTLPPEAQHGRSVRLALAPQSLLGNRAPRRTSSARDRHVRLYGCDDDGRGDPANPAPGSVCGQ